MNAVLNIRSLLLNVTKCLFKGAIIFNVGKGSFKIRILPNRIVCLNKNIVYYILLNWSFDNWSSRVCARRISGAYVVRAVFHAARGNIDLDPWER